MPDRERLVLDITGKTRKDFTEEVRGVLEQGIREVFRSDRWKEWLIFCSSFHQYSARNRMLIQLQMPYASFVASMSDWNKMYGRSVIKGQGAKGLKIFAPTEFTKWVERPKRGEDGTPLRDEKGKVIVERVREKVKGYIPVSVYDVSQTQGEPLPELTAPLSGSYDRTGELIAALRAVSKVPVIIENLEGPENGYFQSTQAGGFIKVKAGMSDEQTLKTLIHELAHSRLHGEGGKEEKVPRDVAEFEAESIAFIICNHLGIDTSQYSFAYLASWSYGGRMKEIMDAALETVVAEADQIVKELDVARAKVNLDGYQNRALIEEYLGNSEYLTKPSDFYKWGAEEKTAILNRNILTLEKLSQPIAVEICWSESPHFREGELYSLAEIDAMFQRLDEKTQERYTQEGYPGCYDKVMFKVYYQYSDLETGEPVAGHIRTRYDFGDMACDSLSTYLLETELNPGLKNELLPQQEQDRNRQRSR